MELAIIKLGNSKGIRLPKSILDEYKIGTSIELKLKDGYIELRPVKKVRDGWAKAFEKMEYDSNEEKRIPDFFEEEEL